MAGRGTSPTVWRGHRRPAVLRANLSSLPRQEAPAAAWRSCCLINSAGWNCRVARETVSVNTTALTKKMSWSLFRWLGLQGQRYVGLNPYTPRQLLKASPRQQKVTGTFGKGRLVTYVQKNENWEDYKKPQLLGVDSNPDPIASCHPFSHTYTVYLLSIPKYRLNKTCSCTVQDFANVSLTHSVWQIFALCENDYEWHQSDQYE